MIAFGNIPAGSVLPIPFSSYATATGASITLTGLAITDVEIYRGTTVTQRSSDAGVVLIDTDGIDIDGVVGIHGFSVDTGDNTDAGFYAVGSFFYVVVSAVTIDGQTVNFIAATFRIVAGETVAGVPEVDVTHYVGVAELPSLGGTATSGGSTTGFIDSSRAETTNDHWKGWVIEFTSTTLVGQAPVCTGYDGTTKAFTFFPAVVTSVVAHTYRLWPGYMAMALNVTAAAGDPWATTVPGAYGAGTAGKALGDNLNATVSSRSSHSAADVWAAATRTLSAISDSAGITTLLSRLSAALASKLTSHAAAALVLVVDAGSSTTTVVFKTVEGTTPSATNDFYNGRVIVPISGTLAGQSTSISDYVGATKTATVVAMTGTPADNDIAMIV